MALRYKELLSSANGSTSPDSPSIYPVEASLPNPDIAWRLSLHEAQTQVLELIASQTPLSEVLSALALQIESLSSGTLCSILLLDESGTRLYVGAAPSFPESYRAVLVTGIPVGPCHGTCGTAIYRQEPVGTFDVVEDEKWNQHRDFALAYGYRAYWSSPIFDHNHNPVGTFGMVYSKPCNPPQRDLQLIELSTHLAGIAIERHRSDFQLQLANARLEQQVKERTAELELALTFESTLKRITDRVRDSLDENLILQTTVRELAQTLKIQCCDAAIYNAELTTSTITYEYTSKVQSAIGKIIQMEDYADIYAHLLQGQHLQFGLLKSSKTRNKAKRFTILACPIVDNSGVLGDLWLFKHRDQVFSQQEIQLARQVATQCAIALRQSRLYQSLHSQMQEMERLSQLKDDFLSTVSHELRTPITNMKMAITMLGTAQLPIQANRYLDILQQECSRETELINDLLDLQLLDATSNGLEQQDWLDLKADIQCLGNSFAARIQKRGQVLDIQLASNMAPLLTNRKAFERIFSELLNNACKYTPKGGRIQIKAIDTPISFTIVVQNQASIPKAELSRIFNKFYRIANADPWKQGGTGLGLALVKRLIEQIQGSIDVDSEAGWTTFTIQFPRNRDEQLTDA